MRVCTCQCMYVRVRVLVCAFVGMRVGWGACGWPECL